VFGIAYSLSVSGLLDERAPLQQHRNLITSLLVYLNRNNHIKSNRAELVGAVSWFQVVASSVRLVITICCKYSTWCTLTAVLTLHSTEQNRQTPLLRLPAELRNKIYCMLLGGWEFGMATRADSRALVCRLIDSGGNPDKKYWKPAHVHQAFALIKACRQIYSDTKLLPFELNTFHTRSYFALARYSDTLPPDMVKSIRHIRCVLVYEKGEERAIKDIEGLMERLRKFTGLRRLGLKFTMPVDATRKMRVVEFIKERKSDDSSIECVEISHGYSRGWQGEEWNI
jgi:hypothetical protein